MTASGLPHTISQPRDRAAAFCAKYGLQLPILLAPMAGACPASLSIAMANAGGMGAMGTLMTKPPGIRAWVKEFRSGAAVPSNSIPGFRILSRSGMHRRKRVCEPFLPRGNQKSLQTRVTRCHPSSSSSVKHSLN